MPSAMQHRPKALNKLIVHQDIGDHLIKLVKIAATYIAHGCGGMLGTISHRSSRLQAGGQW